MSRLFLSLIILTVMSEAFAFPQTLDRNRRYSDVKSFLNTLVLRHPESSSLVDIGVSDSGERILGVKIGEGSVSSHLLVATHHGNEFASTELALAFAQELAAHPIANRSIYIVPVLNIGGYNSRRRKESTGGFTSYDPNRDYPGPCGTEGPWKLRSTRSLADFIARHDIVASATIHTYWPVVAYPWGNSTTDPRTGNEDLFKNLAQLATLESHYEVGYSGEVIYPADGTYEDYVYWAHGIWALLFEVGYSHIPDDNSIEDMIRENLPGLRAMFSEAPATRASHHSFEAACSAKSLWADPHIE